MLMIRLQRIGRKNDPLFRVVVVDSHQGPKSGKYVDLIGSYNPKMDTISLDGERAKHWIDKGAQVSDTVHNILIKEGVISGKKINVLPKKSPIVKEAEESKDAPAEEVKEDTAEGDAPKEEAPAQEDKAPEEEQPEKPEEEPVEEIVEEKEEEKKEKAAQ